jgi:hypothetical protein
MLALLPEDHRDKPVLDRFLMLLVRDSSGRGEVLLSSDPEDGCLRHSLTDRDGEEGFGSLREGP